MLYLYNYSYYYKHRQYTYSGNANNPQVHLLNACYLENSIYFINSYNDKENALSLLSSIKSCHFVPSVLVTKGYTSVNLLDYIMVLLLLYLPL